MKKTIYLLLSAVIIVVFAIISWCLHYYLHDKQQIPPKQQKTVKKTTTTRHIKKAKQHKKTTEETIITPQWLGQDQWLNFFPYALKFDDSLEFFPGFQHDMLDYYNNPSENCPKKNKNKHRSQI